MSDEKKVEQKGCRQRLLSDGHNRFKQEVVEINQDGKALKVLIKEPSTGAGESSRLDEIQKSGDAEIDHAESV